MAENPTSTVNGRPRVVVVGGGFAGLSAGMALADMAVDVTLIDRRNHHTFQPLLYQVALAVLSPADIAQPIRAIFSKKRNIEVLMDEVVGIEPDSRTLQLHSGAKIDYDYLILGTGSTHSYFGHDDWAPSAPGLKTVEDATEIRRRVLLAFELAEREMVETGAHPMLNFVIIGGGPTGVELAGAISDISKLYMRHDFRHIDPAKARVIVIEGSPRILAAYPEDLSKKAVQQLEQLGVEVRAGQSVMRRQTRLCHSRRQAARRSGDFVGCRCPGLAPGQNAGHADRQAGLRHRRHLPESARSPGNFRLRRSRPCGGSRPSNSRSSATRHADGPPRRADDRPGYGRQAPNQISLF